MVRLYLLRHAQSAPSPEVADSDWPLSERGVAQSRDLVDHLYSLGVTHVRSSPYLRALDTVRPFARAAGLDIDIDPRLRERKLTDGFVDDFQALIERSWRDFDFHLPGCESSRMCQNRVHAAVSECFGPSRVYLLSSHGNAIGLYLNAIDSAFDYGQWQSLRNPDLICVTKNGDALTWQRIAV